MSNNVNNLEHEFRQHLKDDARSAVSLQATLTKLGTVADNQQKLMEKQSCDLEKIEISVVNLDKFKVKAIAYATVLVFILINAEQYLTGLLK